MKQLIFFLLCLPFLSSAQVSEAALLGRWSKEGLVGTSLYNNIYNEVWGLSKGGKEFAVIGSTAGTHFIDVTDPANAEEKFFIPGAFNGDNLIHRDYHDYDCYLYAVADEGHSTLQIIDISKLPESVELVYDDDKVIKRAHNIFIDSMHARLYAFATTGQDSWYEPMKVYDISNPLNPTLIGQHDRFGGVDLFHVHDGYVHDNIAYLNGGTQGLFIVDFTDAANPVTLGTLTDYPGAGYNHSGWTTDDQQYYYMADETWGSDLKVLDVSDPSDITTVKTFDAESESNFSIAHNQIVACNYLYVSYYYDGLQVYDISDPVNPVRVHHYDTSSKVHDRNYEGAWGVYPFLPSGNILVSDMQKGLFILAGSDDQCDKKQATNCQLLSSANNISTFHGSVNIYPQPASDQITIEIQADQNYTFVKFNLMDITGRQVGPTLVRDLPKGLSKITNLTENGNAPNQLPNGIYFLTIGNELFSISQKLVIQR